MLVAAGALCGALAGCSDLQGTEGKDYVGGDGQITVIDPADRTAPVEAVGVDLDGEPLATADFVGQVLVANVWWSGCGPCRKEMPVLDQVVTDIGPDAALLGINIRESSPENAKSFLRGIEVDFPSFYDPGGVVLLSFSGDISPRNLPSTAVLDRQGRLAALVRGEINSPVTLRDVIEQIAAEPRPASPSGTDPSPADE